MDVFLPRSCFSKTKNVNDSHVGIPKRNVSWNLLSCVVFTIIPRRSDKNGTTQHSVTMELKQEK